MSDFSWDKLNISVFERGFKGVLKDNAEDIIFTRFRATSKDSRAEDLDNDEQEGNSCPWERINNQYVRTDGEWQMKFLLSSLNWALQTRITRLSTQIKEDRGSSRNHLSSGEPPVG